jgi:Pectate lyase superfamily protein
LPLTFSDVERSKAGMKSETILSRRNWLRSSAIMAGAAGFLSSTQQAVTAAPSVNDDDPGVFNVLDFGARGDGKADDTDAIQRAIDEAGNYSRGNANKGGVVFLPAGAFSVSRTLSVTQAVKIFGRGQATIDGATHIVPASLDFDVIKIVGVNWGVVLEGFLIKAYTRNGSGGRFLLIQACQHVEVRGVHLVDCWSGALVDSSGDVVFSDLNINGADMPGEGRFGIKCTAASPGNPNATQARNCGVSQWGNNVRTMDGFVLANGYNSFSTINCGALNCNRAFWSTADGGVAPNFFVVALGCSDHSNTGVQLDDGAFTQFSELLVTSSYMDNVVIGRNMGGPIAFSNCVITTSGSIQPPNGSGYRVFPAQRSSVSITGGSVYNVGGSGLDISGGANVVVTGLGISTIHNDKNGDGVRVSGDGRVTLTGLSLTEIKSTAIHVSEDFAGSLMFSGIHQQNADRAVFDDGSSGLIVGDGSFGTNATMDVDVSRNKNPGTCIRTYGTTPSPQNPTPELPASGDSVQNASGTNCMVYITRGQVKEIVVDGTKLGAQTSVYVPINRSIEIQYAGKLEWMWQRVA